MSRGNLLAAGLLAALSGGVQASPSCAAPGAVAGTCVAVNVAATAGQWAIWDNTTGTVWRRAQSWPVDGGGPVPGLASQYRYLRMVQAPQPAFDPRHQRVGTACTDAADLAAGTLTTTCPLVDIPLAERRAAMVCTPRQFRLALEAEGLLQAAQAWVATAPRAVQIEWEYATAVRRDWPTLVLAAAALGIPETQIDTLFESAAGF